MQASLSSSSGMLRRAMEVGRQVVAGGIIGAALCAPLIAGPAAAHQVTDATGRRVEVRDTAHIVSIGSAVTEILFALGVGERVVAVDQTSVYPEAARKLPNVGYMRALSPEGVLSKTPSVIIASEGSGPNDAMSVLEHSSVPVVIIPDGHTPEAVVRKIEMVAAAVGVPEKGAELASAVRSDFRLLEREVAGLKHHPRAVFVLSTAGGAPIVGGAGTSADAMFHLAGLENAVAEVKGYKPASEEILLTAQPEVIVVMSGGGQPLPPDVIFSIPAFRNSPAAKHKHLVTLPGSYLLGFGPRTPEAALDLALAARTNVKLAPLPVHSWSREPNP